MKLNAKVPEVLAVEAKQLGSSLVHFSTDYIFNGSKNSPYLESDDANPVNVYGESKYEGEKAIQSVGGSYIILRTSWVYGARGNNFYLTISRLAKERDELKIVNDQYGIPTWSRIIAEVTSQIIVQCGSGMSFINGSLGDVSGIYHLVGDGKTTWYEFAKCFLDKQHVSSGNNPGSRMKMPELIPISTEEYPLPAKRAKFSVMSNKKIKDVFGLGIPDWKKQLELLI